MLEAKRKELEERRKRLQERLRQSQDETALQPFRERLARADVPYTLVEDAPLLEWVRDRFPITPWNRVDWPRIAARYCLQIQEPSGSAPATWLTELRSQEGLGDPLVAVLYANASLPSLEMRLSDALAHLDVIIDYPWETWIFDQSSYWIFEYHHDGEFCWGRSPSVASW
ncbi:MAG TPA: hypothetical protein VK689_01470 [Armatimonadota bacterium]|nr:hypothetical protein [Armatimonadota bacterium]